MSEPVIDIQHLVTRFDDRVINDHIDLSVMRGEIIGLVGGSGSGKSVLLRTLLGLNRPHKGQVRIEGKTIWPRTSAHIDMDRQGWGVLFQGGALFSALTVRDNVAFPLIQCLGMDAAIAQKLAEVKIELVGLPADARDKLPVQLSGGMLKRAALARSLALDPHLLFLDEPTAGLDPISASAFDELIMELRQDLGLTVFMITHDLDTLYSICDRIAVLVDKKLRIGTRDELLKDPHPWIRSYFHGKRSRAALDAKGL
ncbi:MAG: ATP-binding cassette domain-containing protein [Alphaproteobacteria bacterium]|nr:ATP-binding cassette domain-containing protein [Alphaproteobacteria bacterium]